MKRIGLLSDTHGYWDDKFASYFESCDEIWHAGDIGSDELVTKLEKLKPLRAVWGNIDSHPMRLRLPKDQRFELEGVKVFMTHIGGYPGKYAPAVSRELYSEKPKLFISGHSHILKVMHDKRLGLLHINPGAAGKYGFHTVRTLVRFTLDSGNISDLEVIHLEDR